ncbi:MAG: hypothetical protein HKP53_08595 [Eudoraea sp.]|nr:hypothetical protein [Eudoraea sp.]
MKSLELSQMSKLSGGLTSYEKCVLGSATTGAIAGGLAGGPVGLLAGWVFTAIGAMAGCAIME